MAPMANPIWFSEQPDRRFEQECFGEDGNHGSKNHCTGRHGFQQSTDYAGTPKQSLFFPTVACRYENNQSDGGKDVPAEWHPEVVQKTAPYNFHRCPHRTHDGCFDPLFLQLYFCCFCCFHVHRLVQRVKLLNSIERPAW